MENTMNNRNEIPQQVKQVVSIAETLLQGQILGMYLYGSATMNKLRPDSDIDILIITRQELNLSTKKELTKQLLEISGFVGCAEKKTIGDNCHPSKRHYSVAVSAQMRVYVWGVASERDGSRNDSAGVFRP